MPLWIYFALQYKHSSVLVDEIKAEWICVNRCKFSSNNLCKKWFCCACVSKTRAIIVWNPACDLINLSLITIGRKSPSSTIPFHHISAMWRNNYASCELCNIPFHTIYGSPFPLWKKKSWIVTLCHSSDFVSELQGKKSEYWVYISQFWCFSSFKFRYFCLIFSLAILRLFVSATE